MAIDIQQALAHFAAVRERPGMYLPPRDWKFITAVAYVEGWIEATDRDLFGAFNAWLGEPSIAFWGTIARRRRRDRQTSLSELDDELDAALLGDLFDALDGFLASVEA